MAKKIIIDNFLSDTEFESIKMLINSTYFAWFYQNQKDIANDGSFQFTHLFYNNNSPNSEHYKELQPFLDKLKINALLRIKANLTPREDNINLGIFHIDFPIKCNTAIWYLNTNNGKTVFEDGDEIESVANRMVIFPSHQKHCGTSHTDEKTRIVINFNYI